ncbi:RNase H-like domain found in reverse transcriptase [Popillia japonica]|uniref:RNase H-like domain found in reverse transcriptase n=1 Tax=Popillia japonica TaxID=7064 RepID=A0AAW1HFA4_POPJA
MFTTLDLSSGYLQIPLSADARKKTAIITEDETGEFNRLMFGLKNAPFEFIRLMNITLGPLEFNRLMFGLKNAPFEFIRLMNITLGPLKDDIVMCYLDDLLIPAKTWSEMLKRIELVLNALRDAKLTLKLNKCKFASTEVDYLGFIVTRDGIKPSARKTVAIRDFPRPRNPHDIRRFLGLISFFRRFVPGCAEKTRPLSELVKKDAVYQWKQEQENAFVILKEALLTEPVLALYDPTAPTELHTDASAKGLAGMLLQMDHDSNPTAPTELHTDASAKGLAGMLLQMDHDSKMRLVYCVSRSTTEAEEKYHSSKLELLAVVWCVERLRPMLIAIHFTIVTDCQALIYINSKKCKSPQIARWANLLEEYDYTIIHRSGEKMKHVDALSRAPTEELEETMESTIDERVTMYPLMPEEDRVICMQRADERIKRLIDIFTKPEYRRSKEEKGLIKDYAFRDGLLHRVLRSADSSRQLLVIPDCMRKKDYAFRDGLLHRVLRSADSSRQLLVIPDCMRKSFVVKYHDLLGHFSTDR